MVQEYGADGHQVVEKELLEVHQDQHRQVEVVRLPVERYGRRRHVGRGRRDGLPERVEMDELPLQGEDVHVRPDRPERSLPRGGPGRSRAVQQVEQE